MKNAFCVFISITIEHILFIINATIEFIVIPVAVALELMHVIDVIVFVRIYLYYLFDDSTFIIEVKRKIRIIIHLFVCFLQKSHANAINLRD